ncbi:MAG: GtrA family protein, partial [Proteobacteria bacterium]|nr:GtrA family protein [Pseudomonadota bacterium]
MFSQLFHNPTIRLMFRYGLVGVFASFIHWLVSFWVFNTFHINYLLAHSIGFFSGLLPAYAGHYFFSFKDKKQHKHRFPKFLLVALLGFIAHEVGA